MKKISFRKRVILFFASLYLIFTVPDVFAQCGLPGTPPCKKKASQKSTNKSTTKKPIKVNNDTQEENIPAINSKSSIEAPGYTGLLVETIDGRIVKESYSNYAFNPGANVQIATSYAVLKTFGPDYRFPTSVWTDGMIDRVNGMLIGNIYISGRDPVFTYENGINLANELNTLGIKKVKGDLFVTDNFTMNFNSSSVSSVNLLKNSMDADNRNSAAVKAWQKFVTNAKTNRKINLVPSVSFDGGSYVRSIPQNARLLFSHGSPKMREIVKVMMCYSNNFLAERLGDMLGGAYAVMRIVQSNAQVAPEEFVLATSSGLGINRVTPQAQMKLLRTLRKELEKHDMTFADVMPVAGVDDGKLKNRFNSPVNLGSLIGQAGTLGKEDGGASTLSGEINTRKGKLLFVIFNQRGDISSFQSFQDNYIAVIQSYFGGGIPTKYDQVDLDVRMAGTTISSPVRMDTVERRKVQLDSEYLSNDLDNGYDIIRVKSAASLYTNPNSAIISPLPAGSLLILLDRNHRDGWLNVFDIKTGVYGWVYYESSKVFLSQQPKKQESIFVTRRSFSNKSPEITITNSTNHILSLKLGDNSFEIPANSARLITFKEGTFNIYASVPGAYPVIGSERFNNGYEYSWSFFLEK